MMTTLPASLHRMPRFSGPSRRRELKYFDSSRYRASKITSKIAQLSSESFLGDWLCLFLIHFQKIEANGPSIGPVTN